MVVMAALLFGVGAWALLATRMLLPLADRADEDS